MSAKKENNRVIAVFYYAFENDVTYTTIYDGNWLNDAPYGVVHRIASDGTVKRCSFFCFKLGILTMSQSEN